MGGEETRLASLLRTWGDDLQIEARLSGGSRNAVWAITLNGERHVARQGRRSGPALAWELDLLDHLLATGFRVPRVVPNGDGRRDLDGLVVFTWLDGDPPSSDEDWQRVRSWLGRLHERTRGWPQRPGFASTLDLLSVEAGGDVRLDQMPPEAVDRCRDAWRAITGEPRSVVHGDPGFGNVLISREGVGLVDWDEARVDASCLDLADLPIEPAPGVEPGWLAAVRRAASAWEAANAWLMEPEYARRRLLAV